MAAFPVDASTFPAPVESVVPASMKSTLVTDTLATPTFSVAFVRTVTAPVPSAVAWFASSVPVHTAVPPLYVLAPLSFVVPFPCVWILPAPEIVPVQVTVEPAALGYVLNVPPLARVTFAPSALLELYRTTPAFTASVSTVTAAAKYSAPDPSFVSVFPLPLTAPANVVDFVLFTVTFPPSASGALNLSTAALFVMAVFTVSVAPQFVRPTIVTPDFAMKLNDSTVLATSFVISVWLLFWIITQFGP